MDVCEILKFVAENPRIPFYRFIFLYHENMEFRVFCGFFNEIFKTFQILFFPYMKLQLLINNVFIIFDNCAFKIQNSKKNSYLDGVIYSVGGPNLEVQCCRLIAFVTFIFTELFQG